VPIYVNGKHWGGFRVGYRSSQAQEAAPGQASAPATAPTAKQLKQTVKTENSKGLVRQISA